VTTSCAVCLFGLVSGTLLSRGQAGPRRGPSDRLRRRLAAAGAFRLLDGPVDDTMPANRRLPCGHARSGPGLGMILAPQDEYPIRGEAGPGAQLGRAPTPVHARMAPTVAAPDGHPAVSDQPGGQWLVQHQLRRYWACCVARAAGQARADVFYPAPHLRSAGHEDTGFRSGEQLGRLVPCYRRSERGWSLRRRRPVRAPARVRRRGPAWSPRWAITELGRCCWPAGCPGQRIMAHELVAAWTTDQLTPGQRGSGPGRILDGRGWGFGMSISTRPEGTGQGALRRTRRLRQKAWANAPRRGPRRRPVTQVFAAPRKRGRSRAELWFRHYQALAAERPDAGGCRGAPGALLPRQGRREHSAAGGSAWPRRTANSEAPYGPAQKRPAG